MAIAKNTKRAAPNRKRTARHHKKTRTYGKAYWPYLPMVAIVAFGFLANTWITSLHRQVLSYATNMSLSGLLDGTNQQRSANGLGRLSINSQLNQAAQAKAADMAADNYWAHVAPTGETPWTFISNSGYQYKTAGENLAYGFVTANETITGWMNSPGHRANILNGAFTEVGFGVINVENYQNNGNQTIVVAMYAAPLYEAPVPSQAPTAAAPMPAPVNSSSGGSSAGGQPVPTPAESIAPEEVADKPVERDVIEDENKPASAIVQGEEPAKQDTSKTQAVSRLELLTAANVAWTQFALSMLVSVAVLVFLLRHSFAWHKFLTTSRDFIIKHPMLDIALVGFITLSAILLQTSGYIR